MFASPLINSSDTVYTSGSGIFSQLATNITFPFTGELKLYAPPLCVQFTNVYPSLFGSAGFVALPPATIVCVATELPPLLLKVTVYFLTSCGLDGVWLCDELLLELDVWFLVHLAVSVMSFSTLVLKLNDLLSKYQPLNV